MKYKHWKRALDIIISIIIMPFWLIILLIIFLLILIDDQGPLFYKSDRLGKNGKVFQMYKFRSMKVNAPDLRNEDGSTFNSENDQRLTRLGKILRRTSLDETPQIINVLKGDMSLIGPRPDLPDAINLYNNYQKNKLNLQPGITGYNQAYYRNSVNMEKKLNNDAYYVENISFKMDFKIFINTIRSVFLKDNIYNT